MKKISIAIISFLLGILLGLALGIFIGKSYFREELPALSQAGEPTDVPSPTKEPEPQLTPELTKEAAPQLTPEGTKEAAPEPTKEAAPQPTPEGTKEATPEPTKEAVPQMTPEPTKVLTPTPKPTKEATPQPTPLPTGIPESQPTGGAVLTPEPTKVLTPTPKPTKKPTPSPAATPMPSIEGAAYFGVLHVEGTHLADEEGTLVQLRGVSTHGLGWFPEYVNETAIRQLKEEWGCNVVRLAMYTAEYNGYCTSGDSQKQNLRNIIDTGVRAASEQDMYVIIDWHILSDGNPNTNKEEAKKFFAQMAELYADNPHVIYEICNEPNGGASWSEIKRYALEIIPIIRKYAPEAVIIVGTPTWSQDVDVAAKDPITEYDNIMYALHFYADTHRDNLRNKCRQAVEAGLPVFVTEYGICDASGNGAINESEANKWISLLDSLGISHVIWNLSNKAESSALIKSSSSKKSGFSMSDLSAGGKWFIGMMEKAGKNDGTLEGSEEDISDPSGGEHNSSSGNSSGGSSTNDGNQTSSGGESSGGNQTTEDYIAYGSSLLTAGDGLTLKVTNGWRLENGTGLQVELTVENPNGTEEADWVREFFVKGQDETGRKVKLSVSQIWNAQAEAIGDGTILLTPMEYNKTVPASGNVGGIGMILEITW